MRRLDAPELLLSLVGALCAVAVIVFWIARDADAVDAASAPLGAVEAADADGRATEVHAEPSVLVTGSEAPFPEQRVPVARAPRTLLELHPDRSQLDFVVSATGARAAGAVIVLFSSSEPASPTFVAAPGLALTEDGGVVTDPAGRASVAVAPKREWRGFVRWTPPAPAAPVRAEFSAVSPIAGYPRTIAIDLESLDRSRFLHVEVCSAPLGRILCGAELYAIMDDGGPAGSELGPTRVVSGVDGRALLWWPRGARLRVEAEGHTPLELPSSYPDRIPAEVVHTTLEAAATAKPATLELSALGAMHGRLDPSWAAGGRVVVRGPTMGSLGARRVSGSVAATIQEPSSATVDATGHWRIDGLATELVPDPARVFAVVSRAGLTLEFEGAPAVDASCVVTGTLQADVRLAPAEDREVPDPFGACAPVWLTAHGPEHLDLEGALIHLELRRLPDSEHLAGEPADGGPADPPPAVGEPAGGAPVDPDARRAARRARSTLQRLMAVPRMVAVGRITAAGRVVAPDLPLGLYELRVSGVAAVEERLDDLVLRPSSRVIRLGGPDGFERPGGAWGRFEHAGRAVDVHLTSEPPQGDD